MRYALIKFRVYLLGEQTPLTCPNTGLTNCFSYNFVVHYKPGKSNILADTRSWCPDYDPRESLGRQAAVDDEDNSCATCIPSGLNQTSVVPKMSLREAIADAYKYDEPYAGILVLSAHLAMRP
ncbi:polyprotein [Phytophthora megakarya]|uniref:Polyprotein n=1 Tax=Phytophthora megakarya TaxID=4795 RepID=A0A225W9E7_9STRA|nr:polyprotein [Phytophthora megakarya]